MRISKGINRKEFRETYGSKAQCLDYLSQHKLSLEFFKSDLVCWKVWSRINYCIIIPPQSSL